MKKIKILQFPIANSNGGITHYALNNWKWMDKNRFECDFATMSKNLDFADEILGMDSKIHYISCYAEEDQKQFIKEFREVLKRGNYDVVHLHTKQWKSLVVEELCKEENIPKVIVHAHNTGIDVLDKDKREEELRAHETIKKKLNINTATDFWACSNLAADFLFGNSIPNNRIQIMPNAIDIDKFVFNKGVRDEYRRKYGLENSFVVGHAGRFEYQKNHEFLIDVFANLTKSIDNTKLVLLGNGSMLSQMRNKVEKLGIEKKVLFLGNRADINHWYQAMDVFCFPSRFEGLGIVLIEAQSAGLPCIVSEAVPQEIKIQQEISVKPFDIDSWTKQILHYKNQSNRTQNQDKMIKAGYDISKQIKIVEKEYMKWRERRTENIEKAENCN